jgi:DnaK suppressor protein
MTQEEKAWIRDKINHEITTLEKSISILSDLIEGEVQSDVNDWYTSNESNASKEINELALEKAKQRIVMLRDVLIRVDSPEYGICIKCHKPIPFERLKAVPSTTRCLSCG